MPHNENSRVKIPALVHFTRLGYKYISLRKYEGVIDDDTNILVDVLCDAINRINATSLTTTDVQKIVNALKAMLENDDLGREFYSVLINGYNGLKTSVYKGYKQDKIEMRGDRAEMSDFPLYLNTVAGGLDRRDQTIGGFSFVVKIYAVPVVEIIG